MDILSREIIGYGIGLLSVVLSVLFHVRSQKKNKERLVRLLDPHVVHRDLMTCRDRILRGKAPLVTRVFSNSNSDLYGLHDLRILQQTIRNVQKYVLVVRSENYTEYERLIEEALEYLKSGDAGRGIAQLDEAIAMLAAEAKIFAE